MIAYIALGLDIILLVALIVCISNINNLKKKYGKFMTRLGKGNNFEEMLKGYIDNVDDISKENKVIRNELKRLYDEQQRAIQKVGIVRYNAFADTGSDLCFALALLDANDNGVVINGVYSRDNVTTTYAKPIEHGTSKYALGKEEEEAIKKAKEM